MKLIIITELVEVGINYKNIEHFKSLGYDVKCSERINVPVEHLTSQSNIRICVKCGVCGNTKTIKYQSYQKGTNFGKKIYTCSPKCAWCKNAETNLEKYGCVCALQNQEISKKSKQTLLNTYGAENISKTEYFSIKYKEIMNEKYGVDNAFQSEDIKNKSKQTMIDKYGVEYNTQRQEIKEKFLIGENNNSYIDGRSKNSELNGEWYGNKKADKARFEVFNRDNRVCKCCGGYNKIINCHHLYSRNLRPDLMYDIDNMITLCKECHVGFHSIFGFGNNTPEQYYEFLKSESVETIENTSE